MSLLIVDQTDCDQTDESSKCMVSRFEYSWFLTYLCSWASREPCTKVPGTLPIQELPKLSSFS